MLIRYSVSAILLVISIENLASFQFFIEKIWFNLVEQSFKSSKRTLKGIIIDIKVQQFGIVIIIIFVET